MEDIKFSLEDKKLRQRFVSDFNLPIQVLHSPFFEDRLDLFEEKFGARTKFNELLKLINEKFQNKIGLFLEKYSEIRENIISTIKASEHFKSISEADLLEYKVNIPKSFKTIYTETNTKEGDNFYISFDLRKANYQTINWIDKNILLNTNSYEEFIGKFTDLDYFKESKYIRQVIFGQFCTGRVIAIEMFLIEKIYNFIKTNFPNWGNPLVVNSDEIIYKLSVKESYEISDNMITDLEKTIKLELGLDVRITKYKLHLHRFNFKNSSSNLNVFEIEDLFGNCKCELKCVPNIYAPQIYKLLNGQVPNESDRTFYYEHNLATLKDNLILDVENEKIVNANKFDDLPF